MKKKKILLIEDEPEFRQAIRMRLEANGYEMIEAADGVAGLEAARNQSPDLIILDVMMPKLDGFTVARLLKSDAVNKRIPLVMLTVMSQAKDLKRGEAAGADAYLTKPFQPQELLDIISCFLSPQPAASQR